LKSADSLGPWLRRITVNVWRSRLRQRQRRNETSITELEQMPGTRANSDPSERLEGYEVRQAVARLPVIYQEAVVAFYFEGRSYLEASRLVGVPIRTLKTRLYRARELLRQILFSDAEDRR
jgi:RNA polymerase sigma-70 factor (ECF subfamily)